MIEKMAYVNIAGYKENFDRISEDYLSEYDIHLENAVLRLEGQNFVSPLIERDPYRDLLGKAEAVSQMVDAESHKGKKISAKKEKKNAEKLLKKFAGRSLSKDEACGLVVKLYEQLSSIRNEKERIIRKKSDLEEDLQSMEHFEDLNYRLEDLHQFKYVACRFGRIPKSAWENFRIYSEDDPSTIFTRCKSDQDYVYGVFFVPENEDAKADSIYAALRFERVSVNEDHEGTPAEICADLRAQISKMDDRLKELNASAQDLLDEKTRDNIWLAKDKLEELSHNFEAHRFAACIEDDEDFDEIDTPFFFVCGWMRVNDAKALSEDLKKEADVICIINNDPVDSGLTPPTSIKNRGIFKPYEMYTKMYGLPNYREFDPTIIVAILYSFIFGAMFGDLGHGLVLLIGGAVLYFVKKAQLAGIISFAGFFACIFGLLYGSFFGFEHVIPTLWLKPREAMANLTFIGRLNTVFAVAVAFGMILMLVLMVINILSHIKQKDFVGSIFTSNGIAGFLFYGNLVLVVFLFMSGHTLPAGIITVLMLVIPLLLMALNEPLTNLIRKRKALEGGVGMYAVEAFFDLFETCLSYFSNTLSFVRVGAFAVSHAAMMEVVMTLAGYTESGRGSIVTLIIGNIIVIGFEGLIVGIQVLRLQYYEVFSKFYRGDGKEFKPFYRKRRDTKC